ncbi:hypothetical protein SRABI106_03531 [Rahnella aquatilis]|nr:hypothetical protein SRABI106_03531 [Rahnella aquatilis]
MRSHFQHDAVLVRLSKDGGNQPLAERVVQRGIDVRRRNTVACGGVAIELHIGDLPLILQVADHFAELRQCTEFLNQLRCPLHQIFAVGIIQCELVLAWRDLIVHRQILRSLHIKLNARHACSLLLQAFNDRRCTFAAFIKGLQADLQTSAVQTGVITVHADGRGNAFHIRIIEDSGSQ